MALSFVVGYQTIDTVAGFNFIAPTFLPVGGGIVSVQDVKMNPKTAESWSDNLQILDEGGAMITAYTYATDEESGAGADGWLDQDGNLTDAKIPAGSSVLIETAAETTITLSGAVATEDTTVESVAGFNFIGNISPIAIDIQSIVLDPKTAESWSDNLQILDEGGAMIVAYTYATNEESGAGADGWLDQDGNLATVSIEPGQGVLIETASAGVAITLPAAL